MWENSLKDSQVISSDVWDRFKSKCKQVIQIHSKRLNIIKFQKYKDLHKDFVKLKNMNRASPGQYDNEIQNCQIKMNNFCELYNEGCKVRAKVKQLNFEDKPNRFFFNKERKKTETKVIAKLQVNDSLTVYNYKDIKFHVGQFYEQLFQKESIDQSLVDNFLKDLHTLTENQKLLCEGLLTKEGCFYALSHVQGISHLGLMVYLKSFMRFSGIFRR